MIKNLDAALQIGSPWPPVSEIDRLTTYEQNEKLFRGEHPKVFNVLLNLFSSHTAEYNKIITVLNWHKRLSTLWADFLFGERPTALASQKSDAPEQQYLEEFIERVDFWHLQHVRQIDVSRFGHGIIEAYYDDGCKLQVVHPSKYFAIGDEFGRVQAHMIAWLDDAGPETIDHVRQRTLYCRIHWPGRIEYREYRVSSSGRIIGGPENVSETPTGIDVPLVSVVENLRTSSDVLIDDYHDLDSVLKRMEARLTRVGRILDIHSEPLLVLPEDSGAFTRTADGGIVYDSKKRVLELGPGSGGPEYITWEGHLDAAFREFETDLQQLYALSETCAACFEPSKLGAQVSGTALRLMLFVPLKKVDRLKMVATPAIQKELKMFSALESARGYPNAKSIDTVSIMWQDGLPEDFRETVQQISMLKAQGLIWNEMALKILYKLEGDALQEALSKLEKENSGSSGIGTPQPILNLPQPEGTEGE